jgi:hypothetical protein
VIKTIRAFVDAQWEEGEESVVVYLQRHIGECISTKAHLGHTNVLILVFVFLSLSLLLF